MLCMRHHCMFVNYFIFKVKKMSWKAQKSKQCFFRQACDQNSLYSSFPTFPECVSITLSSTKPHWENTAYSSNQAEAGQGELLTFLNLCESSFSTCHSSCSCTLTPEQSEHTQALYQGTKHIFICYPLTTVRPKEGMQVRFTVWATKITWSEICE